MVIAPIPANEGDRLAALRELLILDTLKFDPTANEFVASAVPDGSFPMQILVTFGQRRSTLVISERNE
jgi:hypothetical protein